MTDIEKNEAVARKLGFELTSSPNGRGMAFWKKDGVAWARIPDYCGSIEAAWGIVEHLAEKHMLDLVVRHLKNGTSYGCRIYTSASGQFICEMADTASMAIVDAFLKAP